MVLCCHSAHSVFSICLSYANFIILSTSKIIKYLKVKNVIPKKLQIKEHVRKIEQKPGKLQLHKYQEEELSTIAKMTKPYEAKEAIKFLFSSKMFRFLLVSKANSEIREPFDFLERNAFP